MTTWLRYVIVFSGFCRGFICMRIGAVLPGPIKAWRRSSWLLSSVGTGDRLKVLVVSLSIRAAIYTKCGSADLVQVVVVENPVPRNDEVLVKIHATSVNPLERGLMRGTVRRSS